MNEFIVDWFYIRHNSFIEMEWSAIPEVGECVSLLTENDSEIYGKVTERVWIPSLSKRFGRPDKVLLNLEVQNPDEIDGPLYDEDEDEGE